MSGEFDLLNENNKEIKYYFCLNVECSIFDQWLTYDY